MVIIFLLLVTLLYQNLIIYNFSKEIYRQKLQQCVKDGELSEKDVSALLKLRVMLCIPQQTVEAAHADICGSLFEKVIMFSFLFFYLSIFTFVVVHRCPVM